MSSLLDEVDGFDYSDESLDNTLLTTNFTTQPTNLFPTTGFTTTPTMTLPFATTAATTNPAVAAAAAAAATTPMGVALDDLIFAQPTFDWQQPQPQQQPQQPQPQQPIPASVTSLFGGMGDLSVLGGAAATAAAALPPMPAMPTTVVSNEELESQIIQDSQRKEKEKEKEEGKDEEGEVEEENVGSENVQSENVQQNEGANSENVQRKVKLAELARANVGTNFGMPPFASFVRDMKSEKCLRVKKRYMTRDDINDTVDTHYKMLNSWTPYAEDFYRLNYYYSK